jgi:hypothetical protein
MYQTQGGSTDPLPWTGTECNYQVRVRGTVYLWGSAGVSSNIEFPAPMLLHLRNDVLGEQVTLAVTTAGAAPAQLGTIQPGEVLTIPVQAMTGVTATCTLNSTVTCAIRRSA